MHCFIMLIYAVSGFWIGPLAPTPYTLFGLHLESSSLLVLPLVSVLLPTPPTSPQLLYLCSTITLPSGPQTIGSDVSPPPPAPYINLHPHPPFCLLLLDPPHVE